MDLGGAREGVSILKLEILKKVFDLRSKGRGKEYKHFFAVGEEQLPDSNVHVYPTSTPVRNPSAMSL